MSNNRQQIRRLLFVTALPTMPLWEVWDVQPQYDPEKLDVSQLNQIPGPQIGGSVTIDVATGKRLLRRNFKRIGRAARRRMARDLTKRQWAVRKVN